MDHHVFVPGRCVTGSLRMGRRAIIAAAVACIVLLFVGCSPSGITRERAIELASDNAGSESSLIRAEAGPLGQFADARTLPEEPRDRRVWALVFAGNFEGECVFTQSGTSRCPPGTGTVLVVLDFQTGAFLFSEAPAPPAGP